MMLGRQLLLTACAVLLQTVLLSCAAESAGEDAAKPSAYFPPVPGAGEWETISANDAGFDQAALDEALSYAASQRSSGMVVLYDGRILAEGYWPVPEQEGSRYRTAGESRRGEVVEDVASVQKSVVAFLAGVAEGKKQLSFDAPVSTYLGEGWSEATAEQEARVTVAHLMSMNSGLLTDRSFETGAGEKWRYNTNVYSRLLPVLEAASGLSVDEYTSQWLTAPTGMADSKWVPRPWIQPGQDANRIGFGTSARDLARFGLLMLRDGVWNGEDLLANPGFIERATSPSQELNPSYGYLWWLNGQGSGLQANGSTIPGDLIPSAPADLYAAQGALGRKCYVVPSLKLVVTRLGDQPDRDFNEQLWQRLMAAVTT